jgi:hypothetical protein
MSRGKGSGRVPPKEHQFQPGQSGNLRGRPRKEKRAHVPSQMSKDVLRVMQFPTTIKTPRGEMEVTLAEATLFHLAIGAAKKPSYMRLWVQLQQQALYDNVQQKPEIAHIDNIRMALRRDGPDEFLHGWLEDLIKKSMQ